MKIMRLRHAKIVIVLIVLANVFLFYYSWKSVLWKSLNAFTSNKNQEDSNNQNSIGKIIKTPRDKIKTANKHIRKSITIVFRNFYTFENDLKSSIDSILEVIPNMQILVVQDSIPYPPVIYENNSTTAESTVRFMSLAFDINQSPRDMNPLMFIKTKYVLFMPDSVRLSNKNLLQKILKDINGSLLTEASKNIIKKEKTGDTALKSLPVLDEIVRRIVIVPFAGNIKSFSSCTQINLDLPYWTIQYIAVNSSEKCDLVGFDRFYSHQNSFCFYYSIYRSMQF